MEKIITIDKKYTSLEHLQQFVRSRSNYEVKIDWDGWEQRVNQNGQLEKCLIIKKNAMNGVKIFFLKNGVIKITHIIPNKIMNAYFGKNQEEYQSILEIIGGKIKSLFLAPSQEKAFNEIVNIFNKIII